MTGTPASAHGGLRSRVSDGGCGRGRQPVINVSGTTPSSMSAWLSRMTGKPYRLLSEAEYEYAARAGTQTAYPWGDEIGKNNANCAGCGSKWDDKQTAPVGSFAVNRFGLYDMHGNVMEWVEDCYHDSYNGAPSDGSAWIARRLRSPCPPRRSMGRYPQYVRSAFRYSLTPTTGTASSVSGLPGRLRLESLPLYLWGPGAKPWSFFGVAPMTRRIETMKGPAESGQICSVGRRKIAKKIAKNKRCYANTLRPRSRMLLKGDEGGLGGHYPLGHLSC